MQKLPVITIKHNAGFFSNCSIILREIVNYFNQHHRLPYVDSSSTFAWYKQGSSSQDITYTYFCKPVALPALQSESIDYKQSYQMDVLYDFLNYDKLTPLLRTYFSPSTCVEQHVDAITRKYSIIPEDTIVLFHRGNDKATETQIADYALTEQKAKDLRRKYPQKRFLLQSDETEFLEHMQNSFPGSLILKDEIRHMRRRMSTVDKVHGNPHKYSQLYLAITIIMSRCHHVVCSSSGNCSIWICMYRGSCRNVSQFWRGAYYDL